MDSTYNTFQMDDNNYEDVENKVPPPDNSRFDVNVYATKKSAASGLMDLALLMANASQLKHVIVSGTAHRFYYPMLCLLTTSVILQVIIGVALLFLARMPISERQADQKTAAQNRKSNLVNNTVLAAILLLTTVNVFISAFGLDSEKKIVPAAGTTTG